MEHSSYDVRLDIPARAYLNHQILTAAEQRNDLRHSKEELFLTPQYVNQKLSAAQYSLTNTPSQIASLLYCLIVVPKEILDFPEDHFLFKRLDKLDIKKSFQISVFPIGFDRAPSYHIIQALRNSVAHVLYKIDEQFNVDFWTDRNPKWKARATISELCNFLSTFGKELANTTLIIKRTQMEQSQIPNINKVSDHR
jgi:hypothetical protein